MNVAKVRGIPQEGHLFLAALKARTIPRLPISCSGWQCIFIGGGREKRWSSCVNRFFFSICIAFSFRIQKEWLSIVYISSDFRFAIAADSNFKNICKNIVYAQTSAWRMQKRTENCIQSARFAPVNLQLVTKSSYTVLRIPFFIIPPCNNSRSKSQVFIFFLACSEPLNREAQNWEIRYLI